MNTITPNLVFQGAAVKVVRRDNQMWFTSTQLGEMLGYAKGRDSVDKIYKSRSDEFTVAMTRVIKMITAGGKQSVRIFSLRGAHLLAMFARTDVAKAFRVWVLNILDAEVSKPARNRVKSYCYPISAADPHDRDEHFGDGMLSPQVLMDPRNRALEVELLDQLARDGHDVSGARIRVTAMREGLARYLRAQNRMGNWQQRLAALADELEAYKREQGVGVLFDRPPNPNSPLERDVYSAQLAATGVPT